MSFAGAIAHRWIWTSSTWRFLHFCPRYMVFARDRHPVSSLRSENESIVWLTVLTFDIAKVKLQASRFKWHRYLSSQPDLGYAPNLSSLREHSILVVIDYGFCKMPVKTDSQKKSILNLDYTSCSLNMVSSTRKRFRSLWVTELTTSEGRHSGNPTG